MNTPIDDYIHEAMEDWEAVGVDSTYVSSRPLEDQRQAGITRDIAFRRQSFEEDGEAPGTNGELQVGTDGIKVELIQPVDEESFKRVAAETIAAPVGRSADSVNWEEILRGGLQTVLESQVVVFGIGGVSRACTHQIVRTRKAAYHQQSQRSSYYGDKPETRIAESVWANDKARGAAMRAIYWAHQAYQTAVEEDISYQDARLLLPEGTTNWIIAEYPLRTWLDTFAYRGCSMFQWELVHVFREMRRLLVEAHPWLEPYAKVSCEKTHGALDNTAVNKFTEDQPELAHACTYQGHEAVEKQCDFPWARDTNRTFVPDEDHRIGW